MDAHTTIISREGTEGLAPSAAQPREYPRNLSSARQMHTPHAKEGYSMLTEETKSFKPAGESKEDEETKGTQCNGWDPPVRESVQENRAVDREIHAKDTEGVQNKYEPLRINQTVSLSFGPTHDVSGEGGAQDISPTDDASWEMIEYLSGPA